MKHLKVFNTKEQYNQYKQAGNIEYPLTSYIEETRETLFDYWVPNNVIIYLDDFGEKDGNCPPEEIQWFIDNGYHTNPYYFVDEIFYDGKYFWLWYHPDYEEYILSYCFNNFDDLYQHSIYYNIELKYSPIVCRLTKDFNEFDYDDVEGFNNFNYTKDVLLDVVQEQYSPISLPVTSPYNSKIPAPTMRMVTGDDENMWRSYFEERDQRGDIFNLVDNDFNYKEFHHCCLWHMDNDHMGNNWNNPIYILTTQVPKGYDKYNSDCSVTYYPVLAKFSEDRDMEYITNMQQYHNDVLIYVANNGSYIELDSYSFVENFR